MVQLNTFKYTGMLIPVQMLKLGNWKTITVPVASIVEQKNIN
jgi:hypothetical protein